MMNLSVDWQLAAVAFQSMLPQAFNLHSRLAFVVYGAAGMTFVVALGGSE